ncbi:MAG: chalcone isomerase family protein [Deltaproteobacteria bacterium]|nr:chalcone isomerase family protein [Deltaproteobacteria bacterium]
MTRQKFMALLAVFLVFSFLAKSAPARVFGPVTLPDSLSAGSKQLVLNGAGFRKKFGFKIYVCALYLQKRDSDWNRIVSSDEVMGVRMHFVYKKVDGKDMAEMLGKGFESSTKGNTAPIKDNIAHLLSLLPKTLNRNDIVDLIYHPGRGIVCTINGRYAGESPGLTFKRAVFGIWLGDRPVNEDLKKGMLGTD